MSPTGRSSVAEELPHAYPFVPAVHQLERLDLDQPVTLLAGENGAGKSTLVEALAIAAGFAARGGALTDELRRDFEPRAEAAETASRSSPSPRTASVPTVSTSSTSPRRLCR